MSDELDKNDIQIITKSLYTDKDMILSHNTDWTDTLVADKLKIKVKDILACNNNSREHAMCKTFKKVYKIGVTLSK